MQQWLAISQDAAAISILALTIAHMINMLGELGMSQPFGRKCIGTAAERGPARCVASVRRYLCLSVDVQKYGANNDLQQAEVQRDLLALLDSAADRAGLDRSRWIRQPKGDEELALISDDQPSSRVVGAFCMELAAALGRHNSGRQPATRMRLRLALDEGPVDVSANGFAGRAVVGVSRLVNGQPLRTALAVVEQADLAIMVSDGVCRDWIHSGRSAVRAEWISPVAVQEKEYVGNAWLWLPGWENPASLVAAASAHSNPGPPK